MGVAVVLLAVGVGRSGVFSRFLVSSGWESDQHLGFVIAQRIPDSEQYRAWVVIAQSEQRQKAVQILPLPDDLLIPVLGGYGRYPSKAVVGLYKLDRQPMSWFAQSISLELGIEVHGVVLIDQGDHPDLLISSSLSLDDLKKHLMSSALMQQYSTFPVLDRIRMVQRFQSVNQFQIDEVDLHSSFLQQGEEGVVVDPIKFDRFASGVIADLAVKEEGVSVAVLNTTSGSGIATRIARAISNMGVDVVRIESASSEVGVQSRTKIVLSREELEDSRTLRAIETVLPRDQVQIKVDAQQAQRFRGSIVILIGENTANFFKD